jgi:hypothetical protein
MGDSDLHRQHRAVDFNETCISPRLAHLGFQFWAHFEKPLSKKQDFITLVKKPVLPLT